MKNSYTDYYVRGNKSIEEDSNVKIRECVETYNLLIVFANCDRKPRVIECVENFGLCDTNTDIFWFKKDRFKSFLPRNEVIFIGRVDDWGTEVEL